MDGIKKMIFKIEKASRTKNNNWIVYCESTL